MSERPRCINCGTDYLVAHLHRERGGPIVCAKCGNGILLEISRQRKTQEAIVAALGFDTLETLAFHSRHSDPGQLSLELLDDVLSLVDPDNHPSERAFLAHRVTDELLAIGPRSIWPWQSVKSDRKSRSRFSCYGSAPYICSNWWRSVTRAAFLSLPGLPAYGLRATTATIAIKYGSANGAPNVKGKTRRRERGAPASACCGERLVRNAKTSSLRLDGMRAFVQRLVDRRRTGNAVLATDPLVAIRHYLDWHARPGLDDRFLVGEIAKPVDHSGCTSSACRGLAVVAHSSTLADPTSAQARSSRLLLQQRCLLVRGRCAGVSDQHRGHVSRSPCSQSCRGRSLSVSGFTSPPRRASRSSVDGDAIMRWKRTSDHRIGPAARHVGRLPGARTVLISSHPPDQAPTVAFRGKRLLVVP